MIPFKSGEFSFDLPSKWSDITLDQFYRLRDGKGTVQEAASILSGIPVKEFEQSNDLDILDKICPYLSFMNDKFDLDSYFVPDFITIKGVKYAKPKEMGINTAGQKWHLEDAYKKAVEEGKGEVDIFPIALAIYMQPTVTGKPYDSDLVDALVPDILECKLIEAWPLASFFLTNYASGLKSKERIYRISQANKNYVQVLKDLQSSETFQQYSPYRRLLIKALTKLFKRIGTPYTQPYSMNTK